MRGGSDRCHGDERGRGRERWAASQGQARSFEPKPSLSVSRVNLEMPSQSVLFFHPNRMTGPRVTGNELQAVRSHHAFFSYNTHSRRSVHNRKTQEERQKARAKAKEKSVVTCLGALFLSLCLGKDIHRNISYVTRILPPLCLVTSSNFIDIIVLVLLLSCSHSPVAARSLYAGIARLSFPIPSQFHFPSFP
jgi:hypothetical protein